MGKVSCWHEAEERGFRKDFVCTAHASEDVLREPPSSCCLPKIPFLQKCESAKAWSEALGLDPFLVCVGRRGASPTGCSISSLSGCWNTAPSCDFCPGSCWGSRFRRAVAAEGTVCTEEIQPFPAGKKFFLCCDKPNNNNNVKQTKFVFADLPTCFYVKKL